MSHRAVVLTISDSRSRGQAADASGPAVIDQLPLLDAGLIHREIIADEIDAIRNAAQTWIGRCEMIIATGGTGIATRDVTPEALEPLIEKALPGFGEMMRMRAVERKPLSIVSRSGAGIAKGTLLLWLPGSPGAVRECVTWLAPAIKHVCQFLTGGVVEH